MKAVVDFSKFSVSDAGFVCTKHGLIANLERKDKAGLYVSFLGDADTNILCLRCYLLNIKEIAKQRELYRSQGWVTSTSGTTSASVMGSIVYYDPSTYSTTTGNPTNIQTIASPYAPANTAYLVPLLGSNVNTTTTATSTNPPTNFIKKLLRKIKPP